MANTDKDILITPNKGQTGDPVIAFSGANATVGAQTIYANVYPLSNGTISFEGSAGQLFSITNSLSGTIFSVNDVSGIPSIEVLDTGVVRLAQYNGNVGVGTGTISTGYKMQVQGNAAFTNRVGIGTSSIAGISNALVVYGSVMAYGNLDLANPAGGTSGIYFNDGSYLTSATTYNSYGTPGTIQIAGSSNTFSGDSSNFVYDSTNDRLGIGTSTPSNVLSVYGGTPAWFSTTNGASVFEIAVGNSTTSASTTVGYAAAASTPYGYITHTASAAKNITFNASGYTGIGGTTLPKNTLDVAGSMVVGGNYAGNASYTAPTNGLAVQGSVGVGTNGPASTLDVNGWAGFRQGFNAAGAVSVASLTSNGSVTGTSFIPTGSTVPTNGMFLPAANTVGFSTTSTERMRVASDGNVAIGTTTTTNAKLAIVGGTGGTAGELYMTAGTNWIRMASSLAGGAFNSLVQAGDQTLIYSGGTITTTGALTIGPWSASAAGLRMDNWGNVSIGTSSVIYPTGGRTSLGVNGTSQALMGLTTGGTARAYWNFDTTNTILAADTNGGGLVLNAVSANPIYFYTTNAERMRITSGGLVGIATTVPGSTLDVNGIASIRSAMSVAGAASVASLTSNGTITASTFANGATTVNMFTNDTATNTFNFATAATASGATKTINIGTGGAAGSTTTINIGDADGGSTTVNSPSLIIPGNMSIGASILATTGPILTLSALIGGGTGYMNGTHTVQTLSGGTGFYMLATVVVSLGVVTGITLTWGGHRYSAGDVLTVGSLTSTLATTAASGTGTAATLTFAAQAAAPFQVGAQIIVAGVTPTGYNGTYTVTACTTTTVTYANATTGAQTVAGTVKMGAALTNATISVATIQGTDLYISSAISTSIGARLRLEYNNTAVAAGYEYGAITFSSRDADWRGSGDLALIRGVAVGTTGGSDIQFWTAAAAEAPNLSAVVTSAGNFRMYDATGAFYTELANSPTANRTITIPDVAGTMSIIQAAATNGYFDTSTTTPTGTARLNYNGYFYPTFINLSGSGDTATAATHYYVETASDGFVRPKTLANARTEIVTTAAVNAAAATTVGTVTSGIWNAGDVTAANITFNTSLGMPSTYGTNQIKAGTADGASFTAYNIAIRSWWGIGFRDYLDSTTVKMYIDCRSGHLGMSGSLGVGGAAGATAGTILATNEITAYSSDGRLKLNVEPISDPLDKVRKLRGVTFDWDVEKTRKLDFDPVKTHDVGVIAQDVEAVLPEAVRPAPFDQDFTDGVYSSKSGENYLTVQYEKLTALLIEAVKEQQVMIDDLRNRVATLESRIGEK